MAQFRIFMSEMIANKVLKKVEELVERTSLVFSTS